MALVPERSGGRQEKGSGDHGGDEGEAEQEEGMALEAGAVAGCDAVGEGEGSGVGGAETPGGKCRHG